ncbi:MAG: GGDEF domain-containing protein [Chloroflexi bacterium]|nr:GGDEF domain-containing protein [Chloroflexota bacterium]
MSSDQITYVLVAFIVTGVAIFLLLAGALIARRGRGGAGQPPPAQDLAAPATFVGAPAAAPSALPAMTAPAAAAVPPAATGLPAPGRALAAESAAAPPTGAVAPSASVEAPLPAPPHVEEEHAADETGVTPADLEAAARRVNDPREQDVIEGFLSISPRRRETTGFEAPRRPTSAGPAAAGGEAPPPQPAIPVDVFVDDVTGLDSREAWERALGEESARYVRYRRPVGVIVAELDGLARFEHQFGTDASRRILSAIGGAMRLSARRTDRVAHLGGGRFMVLLPETDEIQAINYVERIRGECERWLAAGAVALHLSIGWASPSAVGELDTALRTAEERMYAERRRAARAGVGDSDASR